MKHTILTLCIIAMFSAIWNYSPTVANAAPESEIIKIQQQKEILLRLIGILQNMLADLEAKTYTHPLPGVKIITKKEPPEAVHFGTPVGSDVVATADGIVITSKRNGWNNGFANHIVIEHKNKVTSLYAHLSENFVEVGDIVTQGELIGLSGESGNTTGPVLYFEMNGVENPFLEIH